MTAIVTPAEITAHLDSMTAVELRKLGATMGIKGASKGKKADLVSAIAAIRIAQAEEAAKVEAAVDAKVNKGVDATAGDDSETAKKARRSRRGMVIVAKGTEVHKSLTFKLAAEAIGWTVEIERLTEVVEEDGEEFEIEKHTAVATREADSITMVWNGRAYDYPASQGFIGGKDRKIRNLKEALRVLAN